MNKRKDGRCLTGGASHQRPLSLTIRKLVLGFTFAGELKAITPERDKEFANNYWGRGGSRGDGRIGKTQAPMLFGG